MKTVYHLTESDIKNAISSWLRMHKQGKDYSVELKVSHTQKPPAGGHRGVMSEPVIVDEIVAIATEETDYLD